MNNTNGRGAGSRRRKNNELKSLKAWPFIVALLLVLTCFLIVKASQWEKSPSAKETESTLTSALHYPDLEIARRADGAKSKSIQKEYEGFTVMFNPDNGTPDWVGWELLDVEANGDVARSNQFWQDEDVKGCPTTNDYKNSGYDRGHMCPAADQKWSNQAMRDCFVLTNITPQDHALNAGAWQTLEKKERLWAQRDSALVIVAGPIYADSDKTRIGEAGVRVPSAFFKVILAPYLKEPRAIGFIYPNMTSPGNMADYAMSVDDVEGITGLDFFFNLPDDIEIAVEKINSFTEWNQR